MQACSVDVASTPAGIIAIQIAGQEYPPMWIKDDIQVGLQELLLLKLIGRYDEYTAES